MNVSLLVYRFASAWREGIKRMLQQIFAVIVAVVVMVLFVGAGVARGREVIPYVLVPAIVPAAATVFGLYQGSDFRLTRGDCKTCATPKQAFWYFRDDLVAVPEDKSQWKIVPVDARPFPPELIEPDTLSDQPMLPWAPALGGFVLVAGMLSIRAVRKRRAREPSKKVF